MESRLQLNGHDCDSCPKRNSCPMEMQVRYFKQHEEEFTDISKLLESKLPGLFDQLIMMCADEGTSLAMMLSFAAGYVVAKGAEVIPSPPVDPDVYRATIVSAVSRRLGENINRFNL